MGPDDGTGPYKNAGPADQSDLQSRASIPLCLFALLCILSNQKKQMVVRRGAAPPPPSDDSSSDEEDAFSAFGGKKKKKGSGGKKAAAAAGAQAKKSPVSEPSSAPAPAKPEQQPDTSSNKRHHHVSSARQAKMDAMLKELQEAEKSSKGHYGPGGGGGSYDEFGSSGSSNRPPPNKKGSYCEPGTEHLTTNIFVGNLDPCTTEEELTECFRQFGDLYSVKIMWPRTAEERARGRNTGFVCFMDRPDAQEALDALSESDPLGTGRLMRLSWGKNVKKTVKRGTGGVPIAPIRGKDRKGEGQSPKTDDDGAAQKKQKTDNSTMSATEPISLSHVNGSNQAPLPTSSPLPPARKSIAPKYNPAIHAADAIRVVPPSDPYRRRFITTVASFIAKDGSLLERKIAEKESNNPKFSFLTNTRVGSAKDDMNERIFYRWRVYAFAQGDGFDHWRTEPFIMFLPYGRFWIPPSLDEEAAAKEVAKAQLKEDEIRSKQEERKKLNEQREFMTGRQLEHAKFGGGAGTASEGAAKLNDWEMEKFDELFRKKLCQSRESICNAMAFCFEKSGASQQISSLLKEALLEDGPEMSPETRISRLFLLSDVLFNSQQPGVRNAYRYRDAIEAMAPDVFESLGKHGKGSAGRMTMNKIRNAVSLVLSAWANWSVYNPIFLDELEARFEGKELPSTHKEEEKGEAVEADADVDGEDLADDDRVQSTYRAAIAQPDEQVINVAPKAPKGDWTEAQDVDGEALADDDVDGEALDDDDIDGAALSDDDIDGEPL